MNQLKIAILFLGGVSFSVLSWSQPGWSTYRASYGRFIGYDFVSTIAIDHNSVKYFGHYGLQASYDGIDYVSVYDSTNSAYWSIV